MWNEKSYFSVVYLGPAVTPVATSIQGGVQMYLNPNLLHNTKYPCVTFDFDFLLT